MDAGVDILGGDWTAGTLPLRADGGAPGPVATLVGRTPTQRRAVLYLHGFVDYFFHPHVADALADEADVYGLDLRDYGRSIRPGREPNFTTDLSVYAEEIDAAYRVLRQDHDEVVLLGHSTGGLIAALWADARPGLLAGVVLNSPWLDLRGSWAERVPLTRVLDVVGRVAPNLVVAHLGEFYGTALHAQWGYDLAWKPLKGFPVRAGFVRTVRRGHARVARGLDVDCPVLVLTSDASGPDHDFHEALLTSDSVLDVEQMAARAPLLGRDVTLRQVPGGAHDLALSPEPAQGRYLDEVRQFLRTL